MTGGSAGADRARIEALIGALEALDDPRVREPAQELLALVLELHRTGLAHLMEVVDGAGDAGRTIVERLQADDAVSALLLLHGLHPRDLETRVAAALERERAALAVQGIAVELIEAEETLVRIKASAGPSATRRPPWDEIRAGIEAAVLAQAPDVGAVEIEGLPTGDVKEIRFMPRPVRTAAAPTAALASGSVR